MKSPGLHAAAARNTSDVIFAYYITCTLSSPGVIIRLCCKNLRGMLWARNLAFLLSLDNHSKQAGDECHLFHAVSFFDTTDLPFPEHVDRFISL
jgi:hypothetical protein